MKVYTFQLMDMILPSIELEEGDYEDPEDYETYLVITKTNGDIISTRGLIILDSNKVKCTTESLPPRMVELMENPANGLVIDTHDIARAEGRAMPIMAFSGPLP